MHGNTPHAGDVPTESTAESRRALRQEIAAVTASTRDLLTEEFIVGAEISDGTDGLEATVAVQPPVGGIVSTGFTLDDADRVRLARELAAGAALAAKHAPEELPRAAR